jgi:hypothetical protein
MVWHHQGNGSGWHCWGVGKDISFVFLWKLQKGKWFRIADVKAKNGSFSGKLDANSPKMKKGGTFQATIHGGANSGAKYTCGAEMSNRKKVPPA